MSDPVHMRKAQPVKQLADLSNLIVTRRKSLGLTQEDLADAAGISRRSVYAIEHGKPSAHFDLVVRLCLELGIDLKAHPR